MSRTQLTPSAAGKRTSSRPFCTLPVILLQFPAVKTLPSAPFPHISTRPYAPKSARRRRLDRSPADWPPSRKQFPRGHTLPNPPAGAALIVPHTDWPPSRKQLPHNHLPEDNFPESSFSPCPSATTVSTKAFSTQPSPQRQFPRKQLPHRYRPEGILPKGKLLRTRFPCKPASSSTAPPSTAPHVLTTPPAPHHATAYAPIGTGTKKGCHRKVTPSSFLSCLWTTEPGIPGSRTEERTLRSSWQPL